RMTRSRSGLADLVKVGHETENSLVLSGLIHQRLATAKGCARVAKKLKDDFLGFGQVSLAVGLLLAPSRASNKKQLGVGADGLGAGRGNAHPVERRTFCLGRKGYRNHFDLGCCRRPVPSFMASRIERQNPWPRFALNGCFEALPIEPAF